MTWNSPCEDYRIKGRDRLKTMTLDAGEFIRRFLLHVLPSGFLLRRAAGGGKDRRCAAENRATAIMRCRS